MMVILRMTIIILMIMIMMRMIILIMIIIRRVMIIIIRINHSNNNDIIYDIAICTGMCICLIPITDMSFSFPATGEASGRLAAEGHWGL